MNRKIIFEEIKRLNDVINEQTIAITNYSDAVPVIEIDIVLDNIKKLYQSYKHLTESNSKIKYNNETENLIVVDKKNIIDADEEISITPKVEICKEIIVENNINTDKKEIILEEDKNEINVPKQENISEPMPEETISEKVATEAVSDLFASVQAEKPQVVIDAQRKKNKTNQSQGLDLFAENNNKPIVADKFKDDKKSLNDIIAGNSHNTSIGSKMQQSPITDLRTAIRINEKFLFINNLFDGNMQEYNIFIDALNEKLNLDEAKDFINLNKEKNEWDIENDSYLMLMDLVYRRFI